MKNNISLLVGLKNNLDYSINFYKTTRALYPYVEIVFVSYGSTDSTHEWLDGLNDPYLIYYYSAEQKTFSDTFNKCTELATKEYIVLAHNDMVLAPGFIESLEKELSPQKALAYTVVEPPIFSADERPNKIIKDFGSDLETIDVNGFQSFVHDSIIQTQPIPYPDGVSFFLCLNRDVLLKLGGFDPLFDPMFCEDDDIVLRLRLAAISFYIVKNAKAYHFVSKTSRSSEEYKDRTKAIEINSNRNFIRKWGFSTHAAIKSKYDIGFVVKAANTALLAKIEPYCTNIYTDGPVDEYINAEQANTAFNLSQRIKPYNAERTNDVIITFNGDSFTDDTYGAITHLNEIITRKANKKLNFFERLIGKNNFKFRRDILQINIRRYSPLEHTLIIRK
ncbi:glycosyltransferase family 2 protein [Mucilaginibacter sp. JRF]|uniref:glycosyltransferase family 2 protein n=1 Tax=Mucilaginibacter sp. JRF TaxID=2780088 RepID=UPI00187FDC33|nr:glycosyltransferase [Mucilaginibacter sp. JRF]MBE9583918.1 glycosyltransferase family 2 protein [Mucilaginibacter sp. JRF]